MSDNIQNLQDIIFKCVIPGALNGAINSLKDALIKNSNSIINSCFGSLTAKTQAKPAPQKKGPVI